MRTRDNQIPPIAVRKPGLTGSHYHDSREASPYRNVTEQRGRVAQNIMIGQNASHYRDVSKNSRSSAAKSIRGYGATMQSPKPRN